MKPILIIACALCLLPTGIAGAAQPGDIFIIKTTTKSPDAVVAAIKAYSDRKKWNYMGENKARKGTVRLVKLCIPAVGNVIWPAGLELSALLPCGNVGIYSKGTETTISVLHPRYMHILYPSPATERASTIAAPMLVDMLDTVTK